MKKNILFIMLLFIGIRLYSWSTSNEGILYDMDAICTLSDSVWWVEDEEHYFVDCWINILENDTLRINEGVWVKFRRPGIKVYGKLEILGTEEHLVKLYDETQYNIGSWYGLRFYDNETKSILNYCIIEEAGGQAGYEGYPGWAVRCENSSPEFNFCTFREMYPQAETGGGVAVVLSGDSDPILRNCTFEDLSSSIAVACVNQDTCEANPTFINCNFMPNVTGCWIPGDYNIIAIGGGFYDNCYFGISEFEADMSLGNPPDTLGDGVCNTTSTNRIRPRFENVDGVVHPRATPDFVSIDENIVVPCKNKEIYLSSVYPSPFKLSDIRNSSQVSIDYTIYKNNTNISIVIYNIKGQLVKNLLKNELKNKGQYIEKWNGLNQYNKSVSSGVYFISLWSNNEQMTNKIMLIK